MKLFLAKIIVGVGMMVSSLFGHHQTPALTAGGTFNPTGGGTYRLQSSISTTASTLTLTSFKEPVSNIAYTMTYLNSSIEYATIDPQNNSSKEFISFTGITQNSDNTATLTGVTRGLGFSYPYTASTTLAQPHSGQAIFILSNPPQLYNQFYNLANVSTSTNILVFSSTTPPRLDSVAAQAGGTYIATTSEFATVAYVNTTGAGVNVNSTETVKGIVELATALEQASSTVLGATSAGLVTQAQYATDTPLSGCATGYTTTAGAGCSVIAQLTGKIRQTFLNLSEAWTFLGSLTIPASTANPLTLNTKPYQFPTNYGVASSSTLQTDASGNVSWNNNYSKVLMINTTTAGTALTSTTTLISYTLPANTFGVNKQLRISSIINGTRVGGDCGYQVEWGTGSASTTIGFAWEENSSADNLWGTFKIDSYATTTISEITNSQSVVFGRNGFATPVLNDLPSATQSYVGASYPQINLANTSYIAFRARNTTGTGLCTIQGATIEVLSQ